VELCEHVSATTKAVADVTLDMKNAHMKIVLIRGQDYVKIQEDSQNVARHVACRSARQEERTKLKSFVLKSFVFEKPAILLLWQCRTIAGISTVADALARILALERSKANLNRNAVLAFDKRKRTSTDCTEILDRRTRVPFFLFACGVCGTRNRGPTWRQQCRSRTSESSAPDGDGDAQTLVSHEYTLLHMICKRRPRVRVAQLPNVQPALWLAGARAHISAPKRQHKRRGWMPSSDWAVALQNQGG